MSYSRFSEQLKLNIQSLCQLFTSCNQHYALQCNTDGHFSQLIFASDLVRTYRDLSKDISSILIEQLTQFEKCLGTNVKVLTYFLRDFLFDENFYRFNHQEKRILLLEIKQKLISIKFPTNEQTSWTKENINIELLVGHILDTLPRLIFDRKNVYHQLISNLLKHNLNRLDDYLIYTHQLSYITTGCSIDQSRLLDGILLPIHNQQKLLSNFISNSQLSIVFLNLDSNEFDHSNSSIIHDSNHEFFSYETLIYRKFVRNSLSKINLVISLNLIDDKFLFELHRENINVIDCIDEVTFEFLLKVYRCLPCNRLLLDRNEQIDSISTILLDRYVRIDQDNYIYLSSNGSYQTLLTCIPTTTLTHTTRKILLNSIRLVKFIIEQLKSSSDLPISTEDEYLKFLSNTIPELRHVIEHRRIYLSKTYSSNQSYPICIYYEYIRNAIDFLCYINKIDGVYSTTRVEKKEKNSVLNE